MHRHARLLALALLLAAAVVDTVHAADIDNDGFVQDGKTTYCQAVTSEQHELQFLSLTPSSAGQCALALEMTTQVKSYSMWETSFIVSWTATRADTSNALFPRVVNASSGVPNDVVGAELRACRVGSNCESENDVFSPSVIGSDSSIGAFDSTGSKMLASWHFTLPQSSEFVIVGKIALLGETSATDFVVFQRVNPGAGVSNPLGTVQPSDNSNIDQSSSADGGRPAMGDAARASTTTADNGNWAPASDTPSTQTTGSNGVESSSTTISTASGEGSSVPTAPIVGLLGVAAVVVVVVMLRGKKAAAQAGDHFVIPVDVDHNPKKQQPHHHHQPTRQPDLPVSPAMLESFPRASAALSDKRQSTDTDDLEFALGSHEQIVIMGDPSKELGASGHSAAGRTR